MTHCICFALNCDPIAFEDRFNAEALVIKPVRLVFDLVLVIGRCNLPRNRVGGAFATLKELTVTTAL